MRNAFLICVLIFQSFFVSSQETKNLKAKLNIDQIDIFVMIDAIVENNDHIYKNELTYHLLTLKREGNSKNYSKEDRFGAFTLVPNEKKIITSLKLNVEPNQELKVYLFIKNNEQLIARDSVRINEIIDILKTTKLREDEIEIIGLVVENVKTPFGKEFYDIFYQKYNQSGTKYSFVIDVNEKPFIGGRGALISIEVGDEKIFEFQARPDEDMLKKAADHTLKLIENYSKNRNTFERMY